MLGSYKVGEICVCCLASDCTACNVKLYSKHTKCIVKYSMKKLKQNAV